MEDTIKDDMTEQPGTPPEGSPEEREGDQVSSPPQDGLAERIAELEKNAEILKDQLLRKAAEFENYKKRIEGEYGERIRMANEDLLLELLPVIDDFERSLKMGAPAKESESVLRGVELIYQKLMKVLESQGLVHYEVIGKVFDTYYHDALLLVPRDDVPPHTVIEEVEKGYLLHGKVLRHAKVIVSSEPRAEEPPENGSGEAPHGETTEQAPEA